MLRRRFLILLSAIAFFAAFKLGFYNHLKAYFTSGPKLKELDEQGKLALWRFLTLINQEWPLHDDISSLRPAFDSFVYFKSIGSDKYLLAYKKAHRLIEELNDVEVIAILRSGDSELKKDVIQEFAEFLMVQGGFRRFGLKNYRGFIGGVFLKRPYR